MYADDVRYVYNDLGRLIGVVDQTSGETVIYQYEAVGNLLDILRQPARAVSILKVTPKRWPGRNERNTGRHGQQHDAESEYGDLRR
ncbi:MAG: hypothetical protein FJ147_05305 [Deltaproteobacteria bacterium]|nr:hypothetical protein [Deltaproteobacteria bacterium]